MPTGRPPVDVLTRLSRLERQNARLLGVLVLSGFAVAVALTAGAAFDGPKTVHAQKFVVVDAAGKALAELGPKEDGEGVNLVLRDSKGEVRLLLAANDTDASLSLIQNGKLLGSFTARSDKRVLLLLQKDGFNEHKNQMGMGYFDDGNGGLFINDEHAKTVTKLP